jgi:hypothetical protein
MWCEMITELEPLVEEVVSQLEEMKRPHVWEIQIGWKSWFFEEPTRKALTVMYCKKLLFSLFVQ